MRLPRWASNHRRIKHVYLDASKDLGGWYRPREYERCVGVQGFAQGRRLPVDTGVCANVRTLPTLPHRGANKCKYATNGDPDKGEDAFRHWRHGIAAACRI